MEMDAAELWDPDLPPEWAAELGVGEGEAAAPKAGLGDAGEEEEAAAPAYIQGHISDKFFKRGWRMIEGEPLYHNILTNQVQDSPPYDRCGSNGCILEAPPPRSRSHSPAFGDERLRPTLAPPALPRTATRASAEPNRPSSAAASGAAARRPSPGRARQRVRLGSSSARPRSGRARATRR